MKRFSSGTAVVAALAFSGALRAASLAQSGGGFNLTRNTVDGGGATFSTGGEYVLGGTIGQPDASAGLTAATYILIGGFWGQISAPTPSTPSPTSTRTPTQTATPTFIPSPSVTPSLGPTPTRTPSNMPLPTSTATATPTTTPTPVPGRPGDANCDGRINGPDITAVIALLASGDAGVCGADANEDGALNDEDLATLTGLIFGSEKDTFSRQLSATDAQPEEQ